MSSPGLKLFLSRPEHNDRVTLSAAVPALPCGSVAAAVSVYTERLGFRVLHHDDAQGVLHGASTGSPDDTDYGTREFSVLDGDGNLLTFFTRTPR